jgi:hypothetical protein
VPDSSPELSALPRRFGCSRSTPALGDRVRQQPHASARDRSGAVLAPDGLELACASEFRLSLASIVAEQLNLEATATPVMSVVTGRDGKRHKRPIRLPQHAVGAFAAHDAKREADHEVQHFNDRSRLGREYLAEEHRRAVDGRLAASRPLPVCGTLPAGRRTRSTMASRPRTQTIEVRMSNSVFAETKFWLMVVVSVVLPFGIYGILLAKRAISRTTVLLLGFSLVAIAGLDIYFLQSLAAAAKLTTSHVDDAIIGSEVAVALYLLPAMFGGLGVNVISHILVSHLVEAERRFIEEHVDAGVPLDRASLRARERRHQTHP